MEEHKPFIVDYPLMLNDLAPDAKIRGCMLFNYLQDAAGRHADVLGLGLRQLRDSHLIWVLSRIRLQMEDFPGYGDVLRIVTYPSGFDRLFAFRQFRLESARTGRRFGVAGSAWLTLNPETFRPVSPERYLRDLPHWTDSGDVFFQGDSLGKIHPPTDAEPELPLTHRISATQIDYNRHLNNAYYAMFTEDWLGEYTRSLVRVREIQVNFNQSTAFRAHLTCRGRLEGSGAFYVEGLQESGRNAFQARGTAERLQLSD